MKSRNKILLGIGAGIGAFAAGWAIGAILFMVSVADHFRSNERYYERRR
jgi:hypothetical protein